MAYNVKYRDTHKTKTGAAESTAIVELLQDGWAGAVTEVKGHGGSGVYRLSYPKIDMNNPFADPIQKASLEYYLVCQNPDNNLGYDGQAILDEIFQADEQEYRLRLTIDGTIEWEGPVLTDLLEYPEGDYTYWGKIVAKDLTRLSGFDFPLVSSTTRLPVIEVIADILGNLGLGLPIYSYTSWATTTGSTIDFLRSLYMDTYALREYASTGNETDQPISAEAALEKVLRNYCLILRQSGGAWRLYQLSEIADDPTAVLQAEYDSNGALVSETTEDITVAIDQSSRFILSGGVNTGITSIRRARITYDHRSTVSYLKLPSTIEIAGLGNESFTDFFQSDGNQSIRITGDITAIFSSAIPDEVDGLIRLEVGGYYWDGSSWVGSAADVLVPLTAPDAQTFSGSYDINTATLPGDADGAITITYNGALADQGAVPDTTRYKGNNLTIQNPSLEEGGSTAIVYQLTQAGGYSKNYDHGDTWYGVGPASYSRSALRFSNDELVSETFLRRGEDTATYEGNLHRLALREIMDILRSSSRVLQGPLKGDYRPHQVGVDDSNNLFFVGGNLTGYENTWDVKLWELKFAIASDDTLETIYKDTVSPSGGTEGSSTGGGESDHGALSGLGDDDHPHYLNEARGDSRYYTQTELDNGQLDNRYFTETELNNGQLDGRYYTETEVNNLLDGKLDTDIPIFNNTNSTAGVTLQSGDELRILGDPDIDTSVSEGAGFVTIRLAFQGSYATSNNYVTDGVFVDGTSPSGDSPYITLNRLGIGDTYVDMTPMKTWADARYLQSLPSHNHDNRYFTETELNNGQLDGRYYTETEVDNLLDGKLDVPVNIYPNSSQTAGVTLNNGDEIRFLGGGDVVPSVSEGAGYVAITFTYNEPAGAGDNNYVTDGVFVDGTSPSGDNPYITLNRLGIGDTYVDMTPMKTWADARYLQSLPSHNHDNRYYTKTLLGNASVDLDLNSISVGGVDLFPNGGVQPLGTGDDVEFGNGTFNGTLSVEGTAHFNYTGTNSAVFGKHVKFNSYASVIRTHSGSGSSLRIYDDYHGRVIAEFYNSNQSMRVFGVSEATNHKEGSDSRIKTNVEPLTNALDFARNINLYSYNKEGMEERQIGLFAQDLERVSKDAIGWMEHDKFGQIRTLSGYTIGSIALAGVGELDTKIETTTSKLRSRVEELEARNSQLESEVDKLKRGS